MIVSVPPGPVTCNVILDLQSDQEYGPNVGFLLVDVAVTSEQL